jgi:hypothetical protein
MTTHLIGQLLEVKPIEMEDRKTGKVKYSTDLTIMFDGVDEEGYRKVSVETVNTDEEYYDELKDKIGKTVAIAYTAKVDQWGVKFYADRSMPVLELEKNPLDYTKFKRPAQVKKS